MRNRPSVLSMFRLALALLVFTIPAFAADPPPAWLRSAASATVPTYEKDLPAFVLHDDTSVVYDGNMLVTTENHAVRVLTAQGKELAVASALYLVSSGKVREIQAWLIKRDGTVITYDKKQIIDMISDPDDIYNEYRVKMIDGSDDADIGSVFGYNIVSEDRPLYFQEKWFTQSRMPVLYSRYSMRLPEGWKASSVTFNRAPIEPQVSGSTYTWEVRNLTPIRPEPMSPSFQNLAGWLAISYGPQNQANDKSFSNWTEVSKWLNAMYEPQVVVDDAVAAKAQEITANAKTELEKIAAVASYAQSLQYIAIDIGVGSGNGYRPRPSNVVLARGYGDCKDKANLMRAMLRALKIDAYPIAIYSGDPTFVREEWSSPSQFNHCIIAIRVSDATKAPTVIDHPTLGRLMIFDATDPYTTIGDLPEYLQGSNALIIAGDKGGLAKMPVTPAEVNLQDRQVEVSLGADGSVSGTIRERSTGQSSVRERQMLRDMPMTDYTRMIERWLTSGAVGAKLVKLTPQDRREASAFDLDVEFSASNYGQVMQGRLLVFKPVIVQRRRGFSLTDQQRFNPILINSGALRETAVFKLPDGFVVDEVPEEVKMETPFGKYSTKFEIKENKLVFVRSLEMNRTTVPVERYAQVRDFFAKMRDAEQTPVVLVKK